MANNFPGSFFWRDGLYAVAFSFALDLSHLGPFLWHPKASFFLHSFEGMGNLWIDLLSFYGFLWFSLFCSRVSGKGVVSLVHFDGVFVCSLDVGLLGALTTDLDLFF